MENKIRIVLTILMSCLLTFIGTIRFITGKNPYTVLASGGDNWVYSVNSTTPDATGNVTVNSVGGNTIESDVSASANLSQYAQNSTDIQLINTSLSNLTATAGQVAEGYTFVGSGGTAYVGSMANNGAVSGSVGVGGTYTIPAGYHDGSGTVTGPILSGNAAVGDVISGKTFYNTTGTLQTGTRTPTIAYISSTGYAISGGTSTGTLNGLTPGARYVIAVANTCGDGSHCNGSVPGQLVTPRGGKDPYNTYANLLVGVFTAGSTSVTFSGWERGSFAGAVFKID